MKKEKVEKYLKCYLKKVAIFIEKLWYLRWILRSIHKTIFFNFHYLPFRQAIKLPIWLYKPHFLKLKGTITINAPIRHGMIRLGCCNVSVYPNTGIMIENHGGCIVFDDGCIIGNNSALSVGPLGLLVFGKSFSATTSLKLVCYHYIVFEENVLCGWNCLFTDTDFHKLTIIGGGYTKPYDKIYIGADCWFAMNNIVMKGAILGDHCVVASNSLLNKDYSFHSYCLLAGQPAKVVKTGIYRNKDDDQID